MLIVNLSQNKSSLSPYISSTLLEAIENNLKKKKKIILYLNKRGDFTSLICGSCQYIHKCHQCDVSLSAHKYPEKLMCHICGTTSPLLNNCDACDSTELARVGIGTQQIENILSKAFPEINIFRFDTDSIKNKSDKARVLSAIEASDIIIGTKMITTGFNIPNLGLIGVMLLEQELQIPKYNTEENVYSNITQLLGRGSRAGEKTDVLIQTFTPDNAMIKSISEDNYKTFLLKTLEERKLFSYPPYKELITLEYRDASEEKALKIIEGIKHKLAEHNTDNTIEMIQSHSAFKKHNQFYYKLILKGENLRDFIQHIKPEIMRNKGLQVIFD